LHFASQQGNHQLIRLLLSGGASPNIANKAGWVRIFIFFFFFFFFVEI
jgi:ankyrin repeat protein